MIILQLHRLYIGELLDNYTAEYWRVIDENFTITQSVYW